jgi:hypothetical protein
MPRKLRLALIAAVVAIAAAGCGSSGSGPLARAQLVAKADPICEQIAAKRSSANAAVNKPGFSSAKILQVLARLAPPVAKFEHEAIVRLRTLKPAASMSSDWQKLLVGMEQLADDATQIGVRAKANDYKGVVSLNTSGRKVREQITTIATRDGFTYCGRTS